MRILAVGNMYPPHHLGGAELIWRSATLHQRRLGHEVRVLTTDFAAEAPDPAIAEEGDVHRELRWYWRDHRFPRLGPLARLRLERHNARVLDRHLDETDPDAVVWWSMGGMSLALLERVRARGLPSIGIVQDDFLTYGLEVDGWQRLCRRLGPLGPLAAWIARAPASFELGKATEWVFNSEFIRRRAAGAGVDVSGSRVAHPGIDVGAFIPRPPREWKGRLVYLGRIDPRKGIETAIRSLLAIPGATLAIVGDGDRRHLEHLRSLARDERISGRVRFERVPHDRVPGLLADADALLFPVLWEEPWGLVPLEAMASGTPVVATGRGGSGEYLRDRDNCLIYAPRDDPSALAGAVRELAEDPKLRAELRAGGLRTAGEFSVESFNDAVLEAIVEAVA